MAISVRQRRPDGTTAGVVEGALSLTGLTAPAPRLSRDGTRFPAVTDHEERVIYASDPDGPKPLANAAGARAVAANSAFGGTRTYRFADGTNHTAIPMLAAHTRTVLPDIERGWHIYVWEPMAVVQRDAQAYVVCSLAMTLVIAALCILHFARHRRPAHRAAGSWCARVRALDLDLPHADSGPRAAGVPAEVAELQESFSASPAERVRKSYTDVKTALTERKRANAELQDLVKTMDERSPPHRELAEASARRGLHSNT
jgi:hypothetical protein